jgi:hypothetical protein
LTAHCGAQSRQAKSAGLSLTPSAAIAPASPRREASPIGGRRSDGASECFLAEPIVERRPDPQQVLPPWLEVDFDRPAAPAPDAFVDLFNLRIRGADIAEQPDQRSLVTHVAMQWMCHTSRSMKLMRISTPKSTRINSRLLTDGARKPWWRPSRRPRIPGHLVPSLISGWCREVDRPKHLT